MLIGPLMAPQSAAAVLRNITHLYVDLPYDINIVLSLLTLTYLGLGCWGAQNWGLTFHKSLHCSHRHPLF
jgi:hypothetical protein